MRTSVILLAAGIAALVIGTALTGPLAADQDFGAPSPTLSPTTGSWTGGDGALLLLVKGSHGSHQHSMHSGQHHRSGFFFGFPSYGGYSNGIYGDSSLVGQPTCVWNGYKYTCYDPNGNAY